MTACQEVNVYIKRELRRNVMQRLIAYVSGKVQMSGYRARVVTIAQNLRLKGYVQNLEDGRVKVVAEGETDQRLDVAAKKLTELVTVDREILME
jgi:acylphosphatase